MFMDVPNQSRFPRSAKLTLITMVVLGVGLISTLALSQQTQETRSRAAGTFTIGSTTYGSSVDNVGGGYMTCSLYTAASSGTITSIGAAFGNADPNSSRRQYSFAVYSNASSLPGTLLGKSGTGTLAGNSWNSLSVSIPVTAGLSYWLCYNNNNVPTSSYYSGWVSYNNLRYTVQSAKGLFKTQTFGTWPTTFGTPNKTYTANYSIYASGVSLTPTTAPVYPTATPTPAPVDYPTATPTPMPVVLPTATPTPTTAPIVYPTATPTPTPAIVVVVPPTSTPVYLPPTAYPTNTPYPLPTASANATRLSFNLFLHGIGNGGDSSNAQSKGTSTPVRSQRVATVEVLDAQNQVVSTENGTVSFNATTGTFIGIVDVGTLPSSVYTIKVKVPQYLRAIVPGIITLTGGVVNQLPATVLLAGDMNNDNAINIMDYNVLMGCYSDLSAPVNCNPTNKLLADLTDDGDVNQFDYNLFIRELNNRGGQ